MYRIFVFYFLNYYYFFIRKDADGKFAITRALNLILINLLFLAYTVLVLILKIYPGGGLFFSEIKRYGYVYFLILGVVFLIHYLLQKKLKTLIADQGIACARYGKGQNKYIVFSTTFTIMLCFVLVLFV